MTNCKNCGAPLPSYPCKCEYCGTPYEKIIGVDLSNGSDFCGYGPSSTYFELLQSGLISINEFREIHGLEPVKDETLKHD